MSIRGIEDVKRKLKGLNKDVIHPKAERTITEILIVAAGYAANLTPIDTSFLINSQYREIKLLGKKIVGIVGYTAKYASAVHDMSGKLRGQPRGDFGKTSSGEAFGGGTGVGNYWDPSAEPGFLRQAFENSDARANIDAVVERNMQL